MSVEQQYYINFIKTQNGKLINQESKGMMKDRYDLFLKIIAHSVSKQYKQVV